MKKPDVKYIEIAKDILLVVLFLMAVLLFYFFWKGDSLDKWSSWEFPDLGVTSSSISVSSPESIIQPVEIAAGMEAGGYSVVYPHNQEYWNNGLEAIKVFFQSQNLALDEISEEQFNYVVKQRGLQYRFSYALPFAEFCDFYEIRRTSNFDSISSFTAIVYTEAYSDSLYFANLESKKYYCILADNNRADFSSVIEDITKAREPAYPTYYTVGTFYGIDNSALMPQWIRTNLKELNFEREETSEESREIKAFNESFFGENMAFTRRITNVEGSILYVYGYNQKVFTINADGTFEYREEINDSGALSLKFYEALTLAINYVDEHGSWSTFDGMELVPYLEKMETFNADRKKGYRFDFGIKLKGHKIYYEEGAALKVEVVGSQVTYYKRNLMDFSSSDLQEDLGDMRDTDPANVLPTYSGPIVEVIRGFKSEAGNEESFPEISQDQAPEFEVLASYVDFVRPGFLKEAGTDVNSIRPVWVVKMKNLTFYFDLYEIDSEDRIVYTKTLE